MIRRRDLGSAAFNLRGEAFYALAGLLVTPLMLVEEADLVALGPAVPAGGVAVGYPSRAVRREGLRRTWRTDSA